MLAKSMKNYKTTCGHSTHFQSHNVSPSLGKKSPPLDPLARICHLIHLRSLARSSVSSVAANATLHEFKPLQATQRYTPNSLKTSRRNSLSCSRSMRSTPAPAKSKSKSTPKPTFKSDSTRGSKHKAKAIATTAAPVTRVSEKYSRRLCHAKKTRIGAAAATAYSSTLYLRKAVVGSHQSEFVTPTGRNLKRKADCVNESIKPIAKRAMASDPIVTVPAASIRSGIPQPRPPTFIAPSPLP